MQSTKILIIGGSYAGLSAAVTLLDLCQGISPRFYPTSIISARQFPVEITIVDERDGYYHVIGSPLALADKNYASKAWVKFEEVPGLQHPAISVLHGSVASVDCNTKTATVVRHGTGDVLEQKYDYLIAASGLRRVWPVVPQSRTRVDYLAEVGNHVDAVKAAKQGVVVIGGGAVGIEMAAELKYLFPDHKVSLIQSRNELLSSEPLPKDFKDETLNTLRDVGVEVITGLRVNAVTQNSNDQTVDLALSDGSMRTASHVINAISKSSSTANYLPPECLDAQDLVRIAASTNFAPSPTLESRYHFAVGDIAAWPGIKRCGAAMHMGHYAAWNIYRDLHSLPASLNDMAPGDHAVPGLKCLDEHPPVIGLALGGTAIAYSPSDGVQRGEKLMQSSFGDDLAWSICWNYLKLGEAPPLAALRPKDPNLSEKPDDVDVSIEEDKDVDEARNTQAGLIAGQAVAQTVC